MICVIVAGGRDFSDYELLSKTLDNYFANVTDEIIIISGKARGADTLGEQYAKRHGYSVWDFPAKWDKNADALVAFWDGQSLGTKHMIATATQCGIDVHVVNYK